MLGREFYAIGKASEALKNHASSRGGNQFCTARNEWKSVIHPPKALHLTMTTTTPMDTTITETDDDDKDDSIESTVSSKSLWSGLVWSVQQ
jgi:hypothetical protein